MADALWASKVGKIIRSFKNNLLRTAGAYLFSESRVTSLFIVRAESRARESTERERCLIYFGVYVAVRPIQSSLRLWMERSFKISCHQGNRHAFAREAAKASAYATG